MFMADKIKLTIDGKEVEVDNGATVLQAAQKAGVYIPTLCYHPDLQPYGGCRLCIVEIENMRGMPTSCTTPAAEGMKVTTVSSQLKNSAARSYSLFLPNIRTACRANVAALRSQRYLPAHRIRRERCVTCPKNRHCELQKLVDYIGLGETRCRINTRTSL